MEAVITNSPLWDMATDFTTSQCPTKVCRHSPVSAVQIRAVPSLLPVTMRLPSGENLADLTSSSWPRSTRRHSPLRALQTRASSSSDAPTIQRPSGENSPDSTMPSSSQSRAPVSVHQSSPSPPDAIVKSCAPQGEGMASRTGPAGSMTKASSLLSPRSSRQMRAVQSAEAVRHRSGVCTSDTVAPSTSPASSRVDCTFNTLDWKIKWRVDPVQPTPLRTASCKRATLSLGFARTTTRTSLLTARSTFSVSSSM
mmetsp:Transcript_116253/g.323800  ORF Transcript_116253/g.323800 Transcript_116253/m.323800 type:complete len:254 (-) Transcript_116253:562-1323(-)